MNSGWPSSTTSTARLPTQKSRISSGTSGYVTFSASTGSVAVAERVGEAEPLQRADRRVVEAALQDQADVVARSGERLVQTRARG